MKIKMGEVKYSMKARVKILVNGAAATLLTGAVAAGLIISSTGALQTKNNDVLAARELDENGLVLTALTDSVHALHEVLQLGIKIVECLFLEYDESHTFLFLS